MIKRIAKWIIGCFLAKHRHLWKPGLIELKDEISGKMLKMLWRPDSLMETQFLRYGLYGDWERHSLRIWAHLSSNAAEILDIGANTGIYSLLAWRNNPLATIVAIEPIQINADVLQCNVIANNATVIIERIAMSNTDGTATMYMLKDQLNYMTSIDGDRYALHPEIKGQHEVVPISVPVATWPSVQAKHSLHEPDLIKIDVEGHEVAVIQSLKTLIDNCRPTILLEIIGADNASALNDMLHGFGYIFISIDERERKATVVSSMWDNDHQNFIVCRPEIARILASKGLVEGL